MFKIIQNASNRVKPVRSTLAMAKVLPVQGTNTWRFDTSDGGSLPTNTNDGELNGGALRAAGSRNLWTAGSPISLIYGYPKMVAFPLKGMITKKEVPKNGCFPTKSWMITRGALLLNGNLHIHPYPIKNSPTV